VRLRQIGESQAGKGFDGRIGKGETARIFTGAPLPEDADSIVIQEDTEVDNKSILIKEVVAAGNFVREAGLDFLLGQVLLKAGRRVTARDIGLAAAANRPWLLVRQRPRIAVIATGDELAMPGDPVGPDQIISSNSLAMAAYVRVLGGESMILSLARDTEGSLREVLAAAHGANAIVTIGGASVGDYDLVRQVLDSDGLELLIYKVAMRPGKPIIFGKLGGVPVLGLPGNPVSAGVTSIIFLKPAMERMLGIERDVQIPETALLGCDIDKNGKRQDYLRASLSFDSAGALTATPFDRQDSSMMVRFADADCLIVRPPDVPAVKAGARVEIFRLDVGSQRI
jgi:molybdopterin molybdotransferase